MFYANWEKDSNIKKELVEINIDSNIKNSGIPVSYNNKNCFITRNDAHSLVIGATGSGKTQSVILPLIKLSMKAEESLVINDVMGELYKTTANEFKKRGYNVIVLDFDNSIYGNYWNPLNLSFTLYKSGKVDKALNIIEELGYYLFHDKDINKLDSFWINSCIDYFTGLSLYLIKNNEKDVNLIDVFNLANELKNDDKCKKFLKDIGNNNAIYYNVSGTLESPSDTRGGIISTFNQKMKNYISRENLSSMLSNSDFDFNDILNNKTVVYIISGYNEFSNNLVPLFINQLFDVANSNGKRTKRLNIILDEFDKLIPIKNFTEIINYSRSLYLTFTVVIKSYIDLINTYGKENYELIKLCFANIVYLYANDIFTLEEFSKLCGNKNENTPLITVEELKTMNRFETIILLPRMMPYKTTLVPDYKINWGYESSDAEFIERKK